MIRLERTNDPGHCVMIKTNPAFGASCLQFGDECDYRFFADAEIRCQVHFSAKPRINLHSERNPATKLIRSSRRDKGPDKQGKKGGINRRISERWVEGISLINQSDSLCGVSSLLVIRLTPAKIGRGIIKSGDSKAYNKPCRRRFRI